MEEIVMRPIHFHLTGVALALALVATPAVAQSTRCLPTCTANDARFLAIAGANLVTLSDTTLNLEIAVPAGATSFQVGFFDGDGGEFDVLGASHWDTGSTAPFRYTLFADPAADGTGTTVVELLPGMAFINSDAMPNNAWIDFPVATSPIALAPSGNYFYRLSIELMDPGLTTLNAFKVRTSAVVSGLTLDPQAQPFSYIANWTGIDDITIVYPDFPNPAPTTYDGTFSFFFDVPATQSEVAVWDGDFDRGDFDGNNLDSDDPDTPNDPFLPPWATGDANFEGVATGGENASTTGNPADNQDGSGFGAFILREPTVAYDLVFSDGQVFTDANPSGNQEWEQFRISTLPGDPLADFTATSIPPGVYEFRVRGVDMLNLNAILIPFRVMCVDEDGTPCAALRPYLVGDTVFEDRDGDGQQDAGEPGIAGVTVELRDTSGALLASATTDSDGFYSFPVESGSYEVEVTAANFNAGGPLAGTVSTTGNDRTEEVTTDNVLTYDFGYRGTASLGDQLWVDLDGDGVQDVGEPGLNGVTVTLLGAFDAVIATTVTGGDGNYTFANLTGGTYTVRVEAATLPAGLAPTFDLDGTGTANTAVVALAAGAARTDVDFGYRGTSSLGDRVWNDSDADGQQDAFEPGFDGVTVTLLDAADNVLATTVTAGDGNYLFTNLPGGTYKVRVEAATLPAGVAPTFDLDGTGTPHVATVALAGGTNRTDVDFGYRGAVPGTGTIGYWKNHSEAWPVQQITIGGVTYSKAQAIGLMGTPSRGDKTIDLFKQLVAARLNALIGNPVGCISSTLSSADAWLVTYPVGSNVRSSSSAWNAGGPLHQKLDEYNNGQLCAPHRG